MEFHVLPRGTRTPSVGKNVVYLKPDNWNDYSFVTMFFMSLHDNDGEYHDIGALKIGFKGQTVEISTNEKLSMRFPSLDENFFSLGNSDDFYRNIAALTNSQGIEILKALRDIVVMPELIVELEDEKVFSTSLLRDVSLSVIKGQFSRILQGKVELTDFKFKFSRPESLDFGAIQLSFNVEIDSVPCSNIHAIIGRNGVGKTTLLNGMIESITNRANAVAKFMTSEIWGREIEIPQDYFSSLVSVSFSAFDPFDPPQEQFDPAKGTCYFYIGLKDPRNNGAHRTIPDLRDDCVQALIKCFYDQKKMDRWLNAIDKLGSDENFASMRLQNLLDIFKLLQQQSRDEQADSQKFRQKYRDAIDLFLSRMSSGHAIVLLTITRLVATVEEKTLVLLDEPESHLHPPLLSAFLRALADLLHDRNGVAIIATHSPVVLQEIPRSCVWKIYRVRSDVSTKRPDIETFGENVGLLTSEVFSLEVERSGFVALLAKSVDTGKSYEVILNEYSGQLGFEGRAILKSLIASRDCQS